jgi:acetolactate synthase-1/2/3 large subunit
MNRAEWITKCQSWKNKWPKIQAEHISDRDGLNIYAIMDAMNQYSNPTDIFVGDAGSIYYTGPVTLDIKEGQKLIWSHSQADMGWSLPAAIGVAFNTNARVIAIIGDGSFMSNIQELATAKQNNSNVKFVILNNGGYLSIKNTQTKYFQGRVYGTSDDTGLWFPDFGEVARTFGLGFARLSTLEDLKTFPELLAVEGPVIIECVSVREQEILPAQALKNGQQAGLHDMTPFLSDDELEQEMIIKIKD